MNSEHEMHTFKMSRASARMIFNLISSHTEAQKNWIASAVESGDTERAERLVKELRQHQELYRGFNLDAKAETAEYSKKPMATEHVVGVFAPPPPSEAAIKAK